MKCTLLLTLVLAVAVAARPAGAPGRGRGRGNGNGGGGGSGGADAVRNTVSTHPFLRFIRAGHQTTTSSNSAPTPPVGNTFQANGGAGGAGGSGGDDPQTSLTLNPAVIAVNFTNNGQSVQEAGQVPSLTSSNNFINFCLTVPQLPITNGQQITTGSCNPAPMGVIPSVSNMPSCKFVSPKNGDVLPANTPFTVSMAITGMETGNFVNAEQNFYAAPQQLNSQGQIIGHSHVVIDLLSSLTSTTPGDPQTFAFFKGLNDAAVGGILTANVTAGLPSGAYRLSSINTAANHQPVLVAIAQHNTLDDAVYVRHPLSISRPSFSNNILS
jgi:hypothetical protein